MSTILAYLDEIVGKGAIRRSDILFSIPSEVRHSIFAAMAEDEEKSNSVFSICRRLGPDADEDDIEVVLRYRDERYAFGDMYEDVRDIEKGLHNLIRHCLEKEYGHDEDGWWRNGIPLLIRQKCVERREEDDEPLNDPYGYTDLVDLRSILDKKWSIVSKHLSGKAADDKKKLSADLVKLNQIRKLVMHPVRGRIPNEQEFDFLRSLKNRLGFSESTSR